LSFALPLTFDFRHSTFLRHLKFVIRHSRPVVFPTWAFFAVTRHFANILMFVAVALAGCGSRR
jgi:hypothetical protein